MKATCTIPELTRLPIGMRVPRLPARSNPGSAASGPNDPDRYTDYALRTLRVLCARAHTGKTIRSDTQTIK
jgi:hypothetical protein